MKSKIPKAITDAKNKKHEMKRLFVKTLTDNNINFDIVPEFSKKRDVKLESKLISSIKEQAMSTIYELEKEVFAYVNDNFHPQHAKFTDMYDDLLFTHKKLVATHNTKSFGGVNRYNKIKEFRRIDYGTPNLLIVTTAPLYACVQIFDIDFNVSIEDSTVDIDFGVDFAPLINRYTEVCRWGWANKRYTKAA